MVMIEISVANWQRTLQIKNNTLLFLTQDVVFSTRLLIEYLG